MAESLSPRDFIARLLTDKRSIQLATLSAGGAPHASYAPYVIDAEHRFYINVSGLAQHTKNLYDAPRASVFLLEDESESDQIFARKRVNFECDATRLARETPEWEAVMTLFEARFGEIVGMFRAMEDFRVFRLTPHSGSVVLGFGQAFTFEGAAYDHLDSLRESSSGGGNPHGKDTLRRD